MMAWFSKIKRRDETVKQGCVGEREREEMRGRLGAEQRALMERVDGCTRGLNKRCLSMAMLVREWKGGQAELLALQAEQESLRRALMRWEIAQAETVDLLREWRDWVRAEMKRVSGIKYQVSSIGTGEGERREMVGSELRVRGVIEEESEKNQKSNVDMEGDELEEWDQYVGDRLSEKVMLWQRRVEQALEDGEHAVIVHGFVKDMRQVHGQAKIWRKLQSIRG
jgi:hypothetical protein